MNNDTIFKASINITTLMEEEILPLSFDLKVGLNFDSVSPYHQAIALERIRYTINVIFQNAIFGSRTNHLLYKLKELTTTPIAECWDEPWDQFIAIMVYYKLTAIVEGHGYIEFINITGDTLNSDDLEYTYYADMLNCELTNGDIDWLAEKEIKTLWYHRSDTSLNEDEDSGELTFKMLGLVWEKVKLTDPIKNNIRKFEPKIIK